MPRFPFPLALIAVTSSLAGAAPAVAATGGDPGRPDEPGRSATAGSNAPVVTGSPDGVADGRKNN